MQPDPESWVPWGWPVRVEDLSPSAKMLRGLSGHIVMLQAVSDEVTLVVIRHGPQSEQYRIRADLKLAMALATAWLVYRAQGIVGKN